MNATKRKFNALVQGIGNRSSGSTKSSSQRDDASPVVSPLRQSASTGGMAVEAELLAKRRRLGLLDSNLPSASTTATISNVILRKWSGHTKEGGPAVSRYCPSDRNELLRRLGTFQELTDWTPKPDRVSEVEWAKRGWVCQGKERVRCTLCNKEVVVGLNKKTVDGKEVSVLVPSEIGTTFLDFSMPYKWLLTRWRCRSCRQVRLVDGRIPSRRLPLEEARL
jgi:hypothetical protein